MPRATICQINKNKNVDLYKALKVNITVKIKKYTPEKGHAENYNMHVYVFDMEILVIICLSLNVTVKLLIFAHKQYSLGFMGQVSRSRVLRAEFPFNFRMPRIS